MRDWLLQQRKEKGRTMKDMAAALGISEGYYCCIENGDRQKRMDLVTLLGIASALECDPAELMYYEKLYIEASRE